MNDQPLQYVVLHHTGIDEPHYDLMLEFKPGEQLITWRSPVWPLGDKTELKRLGPHRREYLTFEGELSDNRGSVKRVVAGTYTITFRGRMMQIVRFNETGEEWLISQGPGGAIASRPTKESREL